jgi:hypothetical protein
MDESGVIWCPDTRIFAPRKNFTKFDFIIFYNFVRTLVYAAVRKLVYHVALRPEKVVQDYFINTMRNKWLDIFV